jgi:hypothetical protein
VPGEKVVPVPQETTRRNQFMSQYHFFPDTNFFGHCSIVVLAHLAGKNALCKQEKQL